MQSSEIVIYLITCVFVIPLVIFVNKRLYSNISNEEHLEKGKVIQYLVKTYALVQCVGWPIIVLAYGAIKFISHFSLSLPVKSLVSIFRFLYTLLRDFVQFHSLIVAIARYTFIVYDASATIFGINRLRKIFIATSIGVPLLSSAIYEVSVPLEKTYINWFYNEEWTYSFKNDSGKQNVDYTDLELESSVFVLFNKLFSSSVANIVTSVGHVLFLIMYSNLFEGCIYTHIFFWVYRYLKYHYRILVQSF